MRMHILQTEKRWENDPLEHNSRAKRNTMIMLLCYSVKFSNVAPLPTTLHHFQTKRTKNYLNLSTTNCNLIQHIFITVGIGF